MQPEAERFGNQPFVSGSVLCSLFLQHSPVMFLCCSGSVMFFSFPGFPALFFVPGSSHLVSSCFFSLLTSQSSPNVILFTLTPCCVHCGYSLSSFVDFLVVLSGLNVPALLCVSDTQDQMFNSQRAQGVGKAGSSSSLNQIYT